MTKITFCGCYFQSLCKWHFLLGLTWYEIVAGVSCRWYSAMDVVPEEECQMTYRALNDIKLNRTGPVLLSPTFNQSHVLARRYCTCTHDKNCSSLWHGKMSSFLLKTGKNSKCDENDRCVKPGNIRMLLRAKISLLTLFHFWAVQQEEAIFFALTLW